MQGRQLLKVMIIFIANSEKEAEFELLFFVLELLDAVVASQEQTSPIAEDTAKVILRKRKAVCKCNKRMITDLSNIIANFTIM